MDIHFDRYYTNPELREALEQIAAAHPGLVELRSLGRSHEDRDIPLVVLSNRDTGPDREKPGFWIDGNIHATELTASMAALYVIHALAERYEEDAQVRRILDEQALYIVPRLNPDGAALALAESPAFLRSGTRRFPAKEKQDGLHAEDIDGDGRILQMRIEDPAGPMKPSEADPRLMIRRGPDEEGGTYYRVLPEGLIHNYDGYRVQMARPERSLDFNRNFPINWRPDGEQYGAGDYPGSEPEIRAVLSHFASHPNIFGGLTFHTYSRAILRPFSDKPDDEMDTGDLWTYKAIGDRGTELTGYPNVSVNHHFRYHPKQTISGVFDDWLYSHYGIFAFTVELWDLPTAAGITEKNEQKKFIEWMRFHPTEDDEKIFGFVAEEAPEHIVDWTPFDHPQLGRVEIGGMETMYTYRNPPHHMLEAEIAPQADFVTAFAALAPRLAWHALDATALGDGHWRVTAVVENVGFLASSGSQRARQAGVAHEVRLEIALPAGAELESGAPSVEVGHLEGRSNKMSGGWFSSGATDHRAKAEWIVRAPAGTQIDLTAFGQRAGVTRGTVILA